MSNEDLKKNNLEDTIKYLKVQLGGKSMNFIDSKYLNIVVKNLNIIKDSEYFNDLKNEVLGKIEDVVTYYKVSRGKIPNEYTQAIKCKKIIENI